ncbi:MAG: spore coat protein CotJB [Peptostreptococcaceae bacterium]
MTNKGELIQKITEYTFACDDMNLYLDTHPDDTKALNMYVSLCNKLNQYTDSYEKKYGPIRNFGNTKSKQPTLWVDSPWPWEPNFNNQ